MLPPGTAALLETRGPYVQEYFEQGQGGIDYFTNARVLCIGAGGLGCEVLKSLALTGFKHIDVIDMDTIDVTNLNRQFLFRSADVGKSKAECAAAFIKRRVPTCEITAHCKMIQEMSDDFYKSFQVVIGGLDSVKARSWISEKLCQIYLNEGLCIPYIDGGTEAWKGHVKVIFPGETACMQCQSNLFTKETKFQFCTIATAPRQPEHCVAYVQDILWPKERGQEKLDGDNDEHINWILERAIEHGKKFGLDGITFSMTRGVVKNIIPAIASTQAIVASMCTTEALKLVTACAPNIDNNINMNGMVGVYCNNFHVDKDPKCSVCSRKVTVVKRIEGETVEAFRERISNELGYTNPSLTVQDENGNTVYIYSRIRKDSLSNITKPIAEFAPDPSYVIVAISLEKENPLEISLE